MYRINKGSETAGVSIKRAWKHMMGDEMHKNSSYLIAGQILNAGAGLLFWIVCARLFTAHDVGLATSLISYAVLIANFTMLGLPSTILRFLPRSSNKSGYFVASALTITVSTIIGTIISILIIDKVSPSLAIVQQSGVLMLLLGIMILGGAINALLDSMFMAYRQGKYTLIKYAINGLPRIVLPFLLTNLALVGIVSTHAILLACGVIYGIIIVRVKLLRTMSKPDTRQLIEHRGFAFKSYIGNLMGILPGALIPIIVLNRLGGSYSAFFYMPLQMAALLSVISGSVTQSFISQAAQSDDESHHAMLLRKTIKHLFRLLVPAVLLLIIVGWLLLRLYGESYAANGYVPLVIMALGGLFVGVNWVGDTWLLVKKQMNAFAWMNALNSVLVIIFVYLFAKGGLNLTAIGWTLAQALTAIIYAFMFMKPYWLRSSGDKSLE